MKPGKSPGPDGLTLQYYRTFADVLMPRFLSALRSLLKQPHYPGQFLKAHITVIPKEGKDSQVSKYQPIPILNVSVKLYTKILANCFPVVTLTGRVR